MAKPTNPYDLIGLEKTAFDPGCKWVIIYFDEEAQEYIWQLQSEDGKHPHQPDVMTLESAPTKRQSRRDI